MKKLLKFYQKNNILPNYYLGYKVLNGDASDLRFLDDNEKEYLEETSQEPAPALGPLSLVLQDTGRPPVDVSIEYLNGITGNFAVARVIGKGAFGDVHLGIVYL